MGFFWLVLSQHSSSEVHGVWIAFPQNRGNKYQLTKLTLPCSWNCGRQCPSLFFFFSLFFMHSWFPSCIKISNLCTAAVCCLAIALLEDGNLTPEGLYGKRSPWKTPRRTDHVLDTRSKTETAMMLYRCMANLWREQNSTSTSKALGEALLWLMSVTPHTLQSAPTANLC